MNYPQDNEKAYYASQGFAGQGLMDPVLNQAAINGKASFRQNLECRLRNARSEVERTEELLQLLDRNPDMYRVLELLGHY